MSIRKLVANKTWLFKKQKVFNLLLFLLVLFFSTTAAMATDYYVDSISGSDSKSGTSANSPLKTLQKVSTMDLGSGDSVFLKCDATWGDGLNINSSGTQQNPLFFGAYGSGNKPKIKYIKISGNHVTISDLKVDRNKESADAIQVTGDYCTLKDLTVQNGTNDGIDIADSNNILIDNCTIHHFLNGSFSNQADAHGIVATGTQGITIRNTEIHHVSGDSFQADPSRNPNNITNDILIENCHFWTAPLTEDFNSGWVKTIHLPDAEKQYPGENAIDTKAVKQGWESVPRMKLTIINTIFHGWRKDGYISNKAALNLKEKIEAVIENVMVYDNEIGFRIRGRLGNANVTIKNALVFICEYALRTENNLQNLKIYDSTFGENINTALNTVASSSGFDTWDISSNAFLNTKPALASDSANIIISKNELDNIMASSVPITPTNIRILYAGTDTGADSDTDPGSDTRIASAVESGSGKHAHFATEADRPGVILAAGFRSDAEIARHSKKKVNSYVSYDRVEDAAKGIINTSASLKNQVRPGWSPNSLTRDGEELWVQFEVKWPSEWLPQDLGGLKTHKAFQLADGKIIEKKGGYYYGQGKLKFEIKSGYGATDSTAVGAIALRRYRKAPTDGDDGSNIRYCSDSKYCSPSNGDFDYDIQPGGDTWHNSRTGKVGSSDHLKEYPTAYQNRSTDVNPFLWLADSWNRVTVKWTRSSGVERVTIWAANEQTGPVKIITDPKNPNQGYKIDYADDEGFNQFWFEFNSSQTRTGSDLHVYFRNFIVSKSKIELGGRPSK